MPHSHFCNGLVVSTFSQPWEVIGPNTGPATDYSGYSSCPFVPPCMSVLVYYLQISQNTFIPHSSQLICCLVVCNYVTVYLYQQARRT